MYTYTIDSGNTFIKVGQFRNETFLNVERYSINEFCINFTDNDSIIYSNVGEDIIHQLPPSAISAVDLIHNFNSTYDQSTYGNDRKIIAAYLLKKYPNENVLIIDAGSFITFDYLEKGTHRGGPIYVGLNNYLKSYFQFSKSLPLLNQIESGSCSNTQEAISTAFVDYLSMIKEKARDYHASRIIITGGDGESLSELGEIDPNLIHLAMHSFL